MTGPWIGEDAYGESDFWWDTDTDHAGQSIWGFDDDDDGDGPWTPF